MVVMGMADVAFAGTLGADALGHIVNGLNLESIRIFYIGNRQLLKAECAVTDLAVEMYVTVIINIAGGVAEFVSDSLTAVINLVQQMVVPEQGKGTEYARFVYGVNLVLQLGHSDGMVAVCQCLKYQKTVGGGLDSMPVQYPFQFFHFSCEVTQKKCNFAVVKHSPKTHAKNHHS